ncbi:hypothetical protein Acsp02_97400 [Actinoplanes sp. NBRC 103695]|nr:hypothetical protein Acsp02_97400 [Actinoplanes sp. NBRC 103695]
MPPWVEYLYHAGLLTGVSFALRELLIAVVTIWSMGTDDKDKREHALKLLKALRVQIRRPPPEVPPTTPPSQGQLPPGSPPVA